MTGITKVYDPREKIYLQYFNTISSIMGGPKQGALCTAQQLSYPFEAIRSIED